MAVNTRSFLKIALGALALGRHTIGSAAYDELLRHGAAGQVPAGYPAGYESILRAAEDEGRLIIYSNADGQVAEPLLADFRSMYPRIDVEYNDLNSTVLHHRFIAETQLGPESADVLWSSAMDQQFSLVNLGHALSYDSPESAALPPWARWQSMLYATTVEPVVMVYNKELLKATELPRNRADLLRLLQSDPARFRRKVTTYDVEKSGVGFFLATRDLEAWPAFWDLARAFGKVDTRFALNVEPMLRSVASGRTTLAYNMLGAYAVRAARRSPSLGIIRPADYTLGMARTMFIARKAGHPNAARLWVDHVLSERGQTVIAGHGGLIPVREDVSRRSGMTGAALGGPSFRPIPLGAGLIGYLNNEKYRSFIRTWRQATDER